MSMSLCEHASLRQSRYCRGKTKQNQLVLLPRRTSDALRVVKRSVAANRHAQRARAQSVLIQCMRRGCIGPWAFLR